MNLGTSVPTNIPVVTNVPERPMNLGTNIPCTNTSTN